MKDVHHLNGIRPHSIPSKYIVFVLLLHFTSTLSIHIDSNQDLWNATSSYQTTSHRTRSLMTSSNDHAMPEQMLYTILTELRPRNMYLKTCPEPDLIEELETFGTLSSLIDKIIALEDIVCQNVCGSDFPSQSARMVDNYPCAKCQCDATCVRYNNCCPDVYLLRNVTYSELDSECVQLSPTSGKVIRSYSSLITSCPVDSFHYNDDQTNRLRCEAPDVSTFDDNVPVTDTSTNLTYKNIYCARCNNASSSIHQWKISIGCKSDAKSLNSRLSKYEMYQKLSTDEEVKNIGCEMVYISGVYNRYRRPCVRPEDKIITRCNEIVMSPYHHPVIEKACEMYTSVFNRRYKNVFCYLCNSGFNWSLSQLRDWTTFKRFSPVGHTARLSFAALINIGDNHDSFSEYKTGSSILTVDCSSTQIFDDTTCSCRDVRCEEWQTFDPETNTCKGGLEGVGVGYRACLRIVANFHTAPTTRMIDNFISGFKDMAPTYKMIKKFTNWCPGDKRLVLHLESWAINVNSKEFYEKYNKDYSDYEYYKTDYDFADHFDTDGKIVCDRLKEIQSTQPQLLENNVASCKFDMVEEIECISSDQIHSTCNNSSELTVSPMEIPALSYFYHFYMYKSIDKSDMVFFPFKRTDHCAFVYIAATEFYENESTILHGVSLKHIDTVKIEFINNKTAIKACLKDYLEWSSAEMSQCSKYRTYRKTDTSFDTWTTSGLISIVTSCVSLFFLFLTFLTYLLFDEIRAKGYENLLTLTIILFFAQALYEFGMEQYENETLCRFFGLTIHYFWLASIFSMNACTIERFVKLCFPLKSRSFSLTNKPNILSFSYTFLCPLLIVGCNIAVNIALQNQIGYGSSQRCYINGRNSRIFSFVVPMCVVLMVNTMLFICTVIKLRGRTIVGYSRNVNSGFRIGLVACVRLSVVTGTTWLISLLYEVVPVQAVGYVFTAMLGLQGVVFFFSLMGNRKVLDLYIDLLNPRRHHSKGLKDTDSTRVTRGIANLATVTEGTEATCSKTLELNEAVRE